MQNEERTFLNNQSVGHLATSDVYGKPHVIPVCYIVIKNSIFITIDRKPKTGNETNLKRLRNIIENPNVAFITDHYEDNWQNIGWIMVRGRAQILHSGPIYTKGQVSLKKKYSQYRNMDLGGLPIICIKIINVKSWGKLNIGL